MSDDRRCTACVTGASGFVASALCAKLLEAGYVVHGTVRSLVDPKKTDHLRALPGAAERLRLFEADLLRDGSFDEAIRGCRVVFHTASPFFMTNITDPEEQLLKPAVQGTLNVLRAATAVGDVERVVLTSSMAAVGFQRYSLDHVETFDESNWTSADLARERKAWYPLSKTLAEQAAWEYAKEHGLDLVVINPCLVVGTMVQPTLNTSSAVVLSYVDGSWAKIGNVMVGLVDIRDVVDAHVRAWEAREASGRYIVEKESMLHKTMCENLRHVCGEWAKIPTEVEDTGRALVPPRVLNDKVRALLGRDLFSIEDMLRNTVASLRGHGYIKA